MMTIRMSRLFALLLAALVLGACTPYQIYRTDPAVCVSPNPTQACLKNALQEHVDPGQPGKNYLLGFIEFDDQGQLWDRRQMATVIDKLNEEAGQKELLIVVFVHGWKHSAAPGDENIETFRYNLERLAELETQLGVVARHAPRKVVGVYLGWRGGSVTVPGIKELTFWDRKNTAHKVEHGGVAEVLARIELVKKTKDAIVAANATGPKKSDTRLVVIGHSFGGALVFSALSLILESRFVDTHGPFGSVTDAQGFGDLVVLINPAFEALRFSALSDMSVERGTYFAAQLPVLAILTSESDYATKVAFPLGRLFSTVFEKERTMTRKNGRTGREESIDQGKANTTAVGHFAPYRTHWLRPASATETKAQPAPTIQSEIATLLRVKNGWTNDAPGSRIEFDGSTLERTPTSAGRNPYLVVQVDRNLIPDHNKIDDPRVATFLRQLIFLSSEGENLGKMDLERAMRGQ